MIAESLRAVVSQRLLARADGKGRVPALEVMMVTKAAANLIRDNKTFQIRSILQTGAALGMVQLDTSLAELVRSGVVTRDEALLHAEEPTKIP
jgi:twitching motility protein PilT